MTSLEIENPGLAGTKLRTARHSGPRFLVVFAAWLVRIEHRLLARKIPAGWDAALSLQLDRLTDIRERLNEYLGSQRRRP
jgi:hypothetical protein